MNRTMDARVGALETGLATSNKGMDQVRADVSAIGGKVDKLVDALFSTDARTAERASTIKNEIRGESDRKAKDRDGLLKNSIALLGAIGPIVSAFDAPWLRMLHSTANGQADDARATAASAKWWRLIAPI